MGGVCAKVSPDTKLNACCALPLPFETVIVTGYVPAAGVVPLIVPVAAAKVKPDGRPDAANVNGAWPVAAIVYKKGVPGRAANTGAPWIRRRHPRGIHRRICTR